MSAEPAQSTLDRLDEDVRREWGDLMPDEREPPVPDTLAEEVGRRQLAGFFEGEGCVSLSPKQNESARLDYTIRPMLSCRHADLGGFAEAEGSIDLAVRCADSQRLNHHIHPQFVVEHGEEDHIREKFERYINLADGAGGITERGPRESHYKPTLMLQITGLDGVGALLSKLFPWLGHKRQQAAIMLGEILPRIRRGEHLTKRGFVELMEWKEKLDEQKPMGNDDRKYTVEYFRDLWADDLDAQTTVDDWAPDSDHA